MRVLTLQSSMIPCVAYEFGEHTDDGGVMFVQFKNGKWGKYEDVQPRVFLDIILDPDSQGSAFDRLIKKQSLYPFSYVDAADYDLHV